MIDSAGVDLVPAETGTALAVRPAVDAYLSEATRARIVESVPTNTRRAYSRQWAAFTDWCDLAGRTALPATPETLAEYVAQLADAGQAPTSIEQAIAAVRTAHRTAGHRGAPDTEAARRVLRGHRRQRAESGGRARQAVPVTIDSLRAMVDTTDPATARGLRDRVALVLGLALMGRRSELVALDLDDVTETDDGLLVLIRASKTDQDAHGVEVAIPHGQHADTDPARLVRAWRAMLAEHGHTTGRLLRSVTRHGRIGSSLSADGLGDLVQAAARRAGLPNPGGYSAHSLRAGGATAAYRAGAPVSTIAAHGRWAPGSPVVLSYVRSVDRWRDNALAGVGL
ncbi:Site-specific recombinase XerD [Pseudonocardia ammonioxydans]|uniref:Site-specific recombinase XerD n=1 Tax=Pseudonocardia ammonioxydans TaxID=260086 RepID=A0A1I5GGI3_PSUAM|nr:tyrosine-type recombinase/integrase [Pseudonocardia ammonioxydans]SFO35013.1 Site-specific recombinase XerD [Pseudonocardia ammonioxydans]